MAALQSIAFGTSIVMSKLSQLAMYRASRKEANDKLRQANAEIISSSRKVRRVCGCCDEPL